MKHKILKLSTVVLLLLFIGVSCEKDELDYADESIEIPTSIGLSIYKTKKDYKEFLTVSLDSAGNVSSTPLFGNNPSVVTEKEDGSFTLNNRYLLQSGYVLEDIYIDHVFTDITVEEMVISFTENGAAFWSPERFINRIIDRNPFDEFYFQKSETYESETITIGEINEMIENGTIENHFTRIK